MKKYIYILLAAAALTSCKDPMEDKIAEYDALMEEAIEVHDEIMPKMGTLLKLKDELENSESVDSLQATETAQNLKKAHEGMMTWMRDYSDKFPYGDPSPNTEEEIKEKMPILEKEVEEIKQLREETYNAITRAEALLK